MELTEWIFNLSPSSDVMKYLGIFLILFLSGTAMCSDDIVSTLLPNSYDGLIISDVLLDFKGAPFKTGAMPLLKTRKGSSFKTADLNYDLISLYSTGNFDDIRVFASMVKEKELIIRFHLQVAYFIYDLNFEGDVEFSKETLREQAAIPFMEKYSSLTADEGSKRLLAYYQNEGFFNAEISYRYKKTEDTYSGTLIFNIKSGKPANISAIKIVESSIAEEASVTVPPPIPGLKGLIGSKYSRNKVNEWLDQAKAFLWENDYLTTDIQILEERYDPEKNYITLILRIITDGIIRTSFNEKDIDPAVFKTLLEGKSKRKISADIQLEWSLLIQDYYNRKGYRDAKVYTTLFGQNAIDPIFKVNIKTVQFLIRKGKVKYLSNIDFSGVKQFSKNDLKLFLADEKELREGKILYTVDRIDQWSEALALFYRSRGYLDARIIQYETDESELKDGISVNLTFFINEGNQNKIKEVLISGDPEFNKSDIFDQIDLAVGSSFIPGSLERVVTTIHDYILKKYNRETAVQTNVYKDDENNAYIDISIKSIDVDTVGLIILNGNFLTDSEYILRNLDLKTGDPLTRSALLSSQLKLYDLGLFSNVELAPLDYDLASGEKRLLLRIRESMPMLLTYGGGFDTENLVRGTFSLSHNNLGGTGKKADFSVSLGSKESSAQLNYQAPRLLVDKWDLFASVFYEQHQKESFGVTRLGAVLQLSTKMSLNMTYLLSFNVENVDLFDVKVSEYLIPPEERAVNLTSLSSTMVIDYRNDPFNPRDGFFISTNLKWANGLLGSNENFLKGYFQGSFYFPLVGDTVFALGFRLGVSQVFGENEFLPPSERFFAGGSNTLRAYSLDSVGPIDEESGYPVGGNAMLISNAELRIPVFGSLGIVFFYDAGSVFLHSNEINIDSLSEAVGIGLRFNTPIGPLRMDWGINPQDADQNQFFVSIGHTF